MKLIVSDFDLTFFDENYDKNIEKVNEFVQKGNKFVIATGRPYGLLKKDIENKNIDYEYLICTDGSVILDRNLNILKSTNIDPDVSQDIIDTLKNNPNIEKMYIDENENKISGIYGTYKDRIEAQTLVDSLLETYDVEIYLSRHWINILSKNGNKTKGIEFLQKELNINESDICTVGDDANDIAMIEKYHGYIVGNKIVCEKNVATFLEFMELMDESNTD